MKMETTRFIKNYLKDDALITIIRKEDGYIVHEGYVADCLPFRLEGTEIDHIEGLGNMSDLWIYIK